MKKFTTVLLGTLLAATAAPAFAQDAEEASSPITVSAGVALVSDYRFRGLSFTDNDFALQPTVTVSHESGFYAGVWGSNIEDSPTYGGTEVDLYAGYATEIAPGTTADLGVTYYWYPGGDNGLAGPSDYAEIIGKLSHTFGPVEATGTVAYAPSQAAIGSDDSVYFGLGLSAGIPDTPVTLIGSVGYADGSLAALAPGGNYMDWSVGADVAFGPMTFGVRYVDTDIPTTGVKAVDKLYDEGVFFSVGLSY